MFSSFLRVCSNSFLCSICLKKYPVIIAEDNKLAILSFEDMEYLIPAHFTAPIKFTIEDCQKLINEINSQKWNKLPEDNKFLMGLYKKLYELGIIPEEVNF